MEGGNSVLNAKKTGIEYHNNKGLYNQITHTANKAEKSKIIKS